MNTDDPNRIIALIAATETLANAWQTMLTSNTADLDPATVQTASANLDATLAHASSLIRALAAGGGEPTPTRLERRLIACAITHTIGSRLAQETSPAAFPTSGSATALSERITGMRADGRVKVFRCCLAPMTVHRIIQNASDTLPSLFAGPITTLLSAIAHTRYEPQLVDALRSAALAPIDNAMTDAGRGYARCGQWVIICEPDDARLDAAVALLVAALAARGLLLDGSRTQTTSFDEEFCHLGTDYTATAPAPRTTIATPEASADRIVYVGKDGTRIHVAKGRLLVDSASGVPQMFLPQRSVTRIVLTGNVGLSAGARSWALRNGVNVVCLSRRGAYQGQLVNTAATGNAARLLAQASYATDETAKLPLARAIVNAKIRNQIHVLNRIARRDPAQHLADTAARMRACREETAHAADTDELMGIEGAASAAYFDALAMCAPPSVDFNGRSCRPPLDVPNAALSYAYAILLGECVGALHAAGLEPSLGVLHAPTDKRPSLALDLMEEFRPLLVDQTVMALLRTRRLRSEHGTPGPQGEGVWLSADGKKTVVDAYEATVQRSVTGALRIQRQLAQTHPPRGTADGPRHRRTRLPVDRHHLAVRQGSSRDLHRRLRHLLQQAPDPSRQSPAVLGLPHPGIRVPAAPGRRRAQRHAGPARSPDQRGRGRRAHLPPVLHLRRARRNPGRCGRARRRGAVQGGVVRNQLSLISSGLSHPSSRLSNRGARPRPDFGFPLFESV